MELLFSNLLPNKTKHRCFHKQFYDDFGAADNINIAVAYITADSISTLKKALEVNSHKTLNLVIGMHYLEKFTRLEYDAAIDLHNFLKTGNSGAVKLVKPFKFHGKLYSYSNNSRVFSSVVGSDNLSSILDTKHRVYESSVRLNDDKVAPEINKFILELIRTSSEDIDKCQITEFKELHNVLEDHEFVEKVTPEEMLQCLSNLTSVRFNIPLKTEPKSNLNVFHGKGRENKKTGLITPRHWYEVEIIVPSSIRNHPEYPSNYTDNPESADFFTVITDDYWKFNCQVDGGNKKDENKNKNLRSKGDLKILGKWIKGRLENAGVLKVGELVTDNTLVAYGRDSFELVKTNIPNTWYLDMRGTR
jgi:HKD family nuclease